MVVVFSLWSFVSPVSHAVEPMAWPLCGRITEAPPTGWSEQDGCPADRARATDFPLIGTYGPRRARHPSPHYEWHRGIDIAATCGTPIFAPAEGQVRVAGAHPRYEDRMIRLRHASEADGSQVHTEYQHVAGLAVAEGDIVSRGQLIGWVGYFGVGKEEGTTVASECATAQRGFLHFEVKDAPANDPTSTWARDSVHPMRVLPYTDAGATAVDVEIAMVDVGDPMNPKVSVGVRMPSDAELDVVSMQVAVFNQRTGAQLPQMGDGAHPLGYPVSSTRFDFEQWNFQYSHKDSAAVPWEAHDHCPWAAAHGANYSPDVHLASTHPGDDQLGWFNGLGIYAKPMSRRSTDWALEVRWTSLAGTADPADLCVVAWAEDIHGARSATAAWTEDGNTRACEGLVR